MVLAFLNETRVLEPILRIDDLVFWSMDLKGAFTLLSFAESDVRHMVVELSEDTLIFFLCGIFGWTGMSAAFQVVSRCLKWELSRIVSGPVMLYVDDIFSVSLRRDLMGPDAIADTKTMSGRRLVTIGYALDLDTRMVYMAKRNAQRTLFGYMTTDLNLPVTVREMMRLGSWASRYGHICRHMKPFSRFLYSAYAGRTKSVGMCGHDPRAADCGAVVQDSVPLGQSGAGRVLLSPSVDGW
jgi:hypothetical protein